MDDKKRTRECIEHELEVARMIYEGGAVRGIDPNLEVDSSLSVDKI